MFLTTDCKTVLKKIRQMSPDLPNYFYSIDKIFEGTHYTYLESFAILNHLEKCECIYFGDKQHTALRLEEKGRNYEEFQRHELFCYLIDKWIDLLAIVISIIALVISIA